MMKKPLRGGIAAYSLGLGLGLEASPIFQSKSTKKIEMLGSSPDRHLTNHSQRLLCGG